MVSLDAFRAEAAEFLAEHGARGQVVAAAVWGEGDDHVALFDEVSPSEDGDTVADLRRWMATRFDAGFGWISGPTPYGGRGLPRTFERAYSVLEAEYDVPAGEFAAIGLGMVAPTILEHGSEACRDRLLRRMYRGEVIGCQLFSEPGAGSDLAAASTRAERDGAGWRITGQKVWSSGAQFADVGEVLVRTRNGTSRHDGLTVFIVEMDAPGVEVRPLRQMTGGATFNEVFFDGAYVADEDRLGEVDHGWKVALTTLLNERGSVNARGAGAVLSGTSLLRRLGEMLRHYERAGDPTVRQRFAKLYTGFHVAKWDYQRAMSGMSSGGTPGPELSGAKLARTRNLTAAAELIAEIIGPRLAADSGEWGTYAWNGLVLGLPGARLAGGTDEIQRNIIAERVLEMPKEPVFPTPG